jgi:hypothetical protein
MMSDQASALSPLVRFYGSRGRNKTMRALSKTLFGAAIAMAALVPLSRPADAG